MKRSGRGVDLMDFVDLMESVGWQILTCPDFDYDEIHEVDRIHEIGCAVVENRLTQNAL